MSTRPLQLLRSSLVSNPTQALIYDDLGIGHYIIKLTKHICSSGKEKADYIEGDDSNTLLMFEPTVVMIITSVSTHQPYWERCMSIKGWTSAAPSVTRYSSQGSRYAHASIDSLPASIDNCSDEGRRG